MGAHPLEKTVPLSPEDQPIDALWLVSTTFAMFPVWGWAVAHNVGDPPYTVRLFDVVHRRFGGRGFIALPVVSVAVGLTYLTWVTRATKEARAALARRRDHGTC